MAVSKLSPPFSRKVDKKQNNHKRLSFVILFIKFPNLTIHGCFLVNNEESVTILVFVHVLNILFCFCEMFTVDITKSETETVSLNIFV